MSWAGLAAALLGIFCRGSLRRDWEVDALRFEWDIAALREPCRCQYGLSFVHMRRLRTFDLCCAYGALPS